MAFGQQKFAAKCADTITEAGLVGALTKEDIDPQLLKSIKFKVSDVSIGKHHSKGIVVHGHEECAGNPVENEKHKEDILKTAELIKSFVGNGVSVMPVFVKRNGSGWVIESLQAA